MRREQFYQLPQFTYYTFNAAENGKPMLNGSFAGQQNGLKLRLNIERESYIPNLIWPSVGIIILIHDQNSFPIVEDFGIAVPPGMSTTCAIRRRNVSAGNISKTALCPFRIFRSLFLTSFKNPTLSF